LAVIIAGSIGPGAAGDDDVLLQAMTPAAAHAASESNQDARFMIRFCLIDWN
jgi:hypothetical protein